MSTTTTGSAAGSATPPDGERQPVVLSEQAHRDINEVVEHYLAEAGPAVMLDFVDALEGALHQISEQQTSGPPRYAHELDIPSLRFRPTGKFPYLLFNAERALEVEAWPVLYGSRDIPAWVREPREA